MSLRTHLLALIAAALLPLAGFCIVVGYLLAAEHRDTFRRGAQERALAMSTAVDAQLESSMTSALALAASPDLHNGRFDAFRVLAERVLATQPDWLTVQLALASRQQILNLLVPAGLALPELSESRSFAEVLETRRPAISDLARGPVTGEWAVAVRIPVLEGGEVKLVLSAIVKPEAISRMLAAQHLPADWVGVVIDRNGRFVARTRAPEQSVGEAASESLRATLPGPPSGWFRGTTIEGVDVYTPYYRSPATGWTFAMGIPASIVDAAERESRMLLFLGLVMAIAVATGLALLIARRLSRAIVGLAGQTPALTRGASIDLPFDPGVREVGTLVHAMQVASQAVREREDLARREQRALRAADKSKNEFLAMLSHELRNPLAALTNAAYLLKVAEPASAPAARARDVVETQTRQMSRLVDDLLDVSRVVMGKLSIEAVPHDLAAMASEVIALWRASGRLEGHELFLDASEAWIVADRSRTQQILTNLIDNALKFTPRGKAIRVRVWRADALAVLQVKDEGEGLDAGMLDCIFDPFVQGRQELDRSRGGMGLGLALVRQLATVQGGSVRVESEGKGHGSCFTVTFPSLDHAAAPAAESLAPEQQPSALAPLRVLLVEDNDDVRGTLRAGLELRGHEVCDADAAEAAIGLCASFQPEVALIDIGLPGMNGYELARALRARFGVLVRLVAISGYGQAEDIANARAAGFDLHVTKPVRPEDLERAIRRPSPVRRNPWPAALPT